jgi:dUTPase
MIPEFKFALRKDLETQKQFLPTRAHDTDTGWDVCCADRSGFNIKPTEYVKIRLGFRMFCPFGWWMELRPRSSSHAKKNLNCLYGTIDETYENELILSAQYLPKLGILSNMPTFYVGYDNLLSIEFGEKIGQLIPIRRKEMVVTEVTNEEFDQLCKNRGGLRGTGGFGSSG